MTNHRFYYDDPLRRKWQNPEAILADLGVGSGAVFMDIGCGTGFFALAAAKIVGEKGKVYALDIEPRAIEKLRETAVEKGFRNLDLKVGAAEEVILCENCADFIFYGIVLHDFNDPLKVLINAKRMLKPTGKLINLDWKKKRMPFGPPLEIRFTEQRAVNLIENAGFKIEASKESGPFHYIIIAKH